MTRQRVAKKLIMFFNGDSNLEKHTYMHTLCRYGKHTKVVQSQPTWDVSIIIIRFITITMATRVAIIIIIIHPS